MDSGQPMTIKAIYGGTGGSGGGSGSGSGGVGGSGQGPQIHLHGPSHWNVPDTTQVLVSKVKPKQRKLCPLAVTTFTGRQESLQEIHQFFDGDPRTRLVFVLHGLGGSGKSQLAFKFVEEAQEKERFTEVFYIDATSKQTAETDLQLLGPETVETAEAALLWLASNWHTQRLIVFDNADDTTLDLARFFPECRFGLNILITTRNPALRIHGTATQVSNMRLDDATELLLRLAGQTAVGDNKKELATAIVKELHCFALAVSQAGGYINAQGDFEGYLALYKVSRDRLLRRNDIQGQSQYNAAVYATWDLSFNKLNPAAKLLLQIFSQLHHEGITKEIFEKASLSELQLDDHDLHFQINQVLTQLGGSNQTWDSLAFNDIVGELQAYSLVAKNLHDQSFSVHPLVQQWSNDTTKQNMGFIQTCALAIIAMSCYFNKEDFKYITTLLHHMTRLSKFFRKPMDLGISEWLAYIAARQGLWSDSELLHSTVLERQKRLLGEEHPDTLSSMHSLAVTYWNQGRWSDAEDLQVTVLESRKRLLGEEHPATLGSMNSLACTYSDQGRWSDAEVAVLESQKGVLGEEHLDTLGSMHNLACTYSKQGRWSDAEDLQVTVLESRKRLLGEEHPATLGSMSSLACTYSNQGRWSDAEELKVKVLESRKRLLGEEHPDTLSIMHSLACTYSDQGRWSDAEDLQVTVLESRKRLLGEEHPATLDSMHNLACIYSKQGRWSDAQRLHVMVLEKRKTLLGKEHPHTLSSMYNLAYVFEHQARYSEAEALRRTAQDIEQRKDAASKATRIDKLVVSPARMAFPGAVSEDPLSLSLHEKSANPRKRKRESISPFQSTSRRNIEYV
ncbi:FabD/lysophospholipase-like protein [Favolaschia claudopus]|uniref:FabD/lysophospholipase-like protein n=1 Tax=Favolaschia claudopus TaxID=2862362 RepID=A0AAW0BPR7_9AGAR